MSDYKVPLTTILKADNHPGADRLSVYTVYGFQVIATKNKFQVGDLVIYIPIDSILDEKLEEKIFPKDGKVKLYRHRLRQIRLRGLASQGLLIDPKEVKEFINIDGFDLEEDLSEVLKVTKYEPPVVGPAQTQGNKKGRNKKNEHPNFHKYNGLDNIKWFPSLFEEGEEVVVQEKLHGTNARASKLPMRSNTLWRKILKLFNKLPKYENLYGSNNVDISSASNYNGYYGEDVYGAVFEKLDVFNKIESSETIFGEIVGPGIQKGYEYSLKEHTFVLFDVKILNPDGTQEWLKPNEVELYALDRGFTIVPIVYKGPYSKELIYSMTKGPSLFDPNEKVREGIVIKAKENYSLEGNKKALKFVNEEYLDNKENTDNH